MNLLPLALLFACNTHAVLGVGDTAVVNDPVLSGIASTNGANAKLFHTFMQIQLVQDAIMVKNNILEAESYYNYIDKCSKHRGGLIGYYSDIIKLQLQTMINQDKMALMNEATTVTGANAVDDFMGAMSAGAVAAVQKAGDVANSALAGQVSSFNAAYNNATNYQVADANNIVRSYQQNKAAVGQAQFARNVTLSQAVTGAMKESNENIAALGKSLSQLDQLASQGDLEDHQYEQVNTSLGSLHARIALEQYKMLNIHATLLQAVLNEATANQAMTMQVQQDLAVYATQQGQQKAKYSHTAADVISEFKRQP